MTLKTHREGQRQVGRGPAYQHIKLAHALLQKRHNIQGAAQVSITRALDSIKYSGHS
jgi:hypothetical protein